MVRSLGRSSGEKQEVYFSMATPITSTTSMTPSVFVTSSFGDIEGKTEKKTESKTVKLEYKYKHDALVQLGNFDVNTFLTPFLMSIDYLPIPHLIIDSSAPSHCYGYVLLSWFLSFISYQVRENGSNTYVGTRTSLPGLLHALFASFGIPVP